MSLQLTVEVQDAQLILTGLAKLPLEASLDTWHKVKTQAEAQLAAQKSAPAPEPVPEPGLNSPEA